MLIFLVLVIIIVGVVALSVITVRQHTMHIVEVFGKFYNAKDAGLRFKVPYPIGIVVGNVDLRIMELVKGLERTSEDWSWNNPKAAAIEFEKNNQDFKIVEPEFPFNESRIN